MDALIESIRTSPAMDAAKKRAREFGADAQNALAILPDNDFRRTLTDLTAYVVDRSQ